MISTPTLSDDARDANPLRWGVLGATAYMSGLMIPALQAARGCDLVAVASRLESFPRTAQLGKSHAVDSFCGYAGLLESPEVDVVYVPLPNSHHAEWTVRALGAGKHVLVEKPITTNLPDLRRIAAAAESAGRMVMEGFMYRFHPQFDRVLDLVGSNEIGELRMVRASFAYPIASGSGNIRLVPELGGGATWDVGCYAVNVAVTFFGGLPDTVHAFSSRRPGEHVDTSVVAILTFDERRKAVIDYSIDYGPRACYELQGDVGSIAVTNAWAFAGEPGRLVVRTLSGSREETTPASDHYQLEAETFASVIRTGARPPFTVDESSLTLRTCLAVEESARGARPVSPARIEG